MNLNQYHLKYCVCVCGCELLTSLCVGLISYSVHEQHYYESKPVCVCLRSSGDGGGRWDAVWGGGVLTYKDQQGSRFLGMPGQPPEPSGASLTICTLSYKTVLVSAVSYRVVLATAYCIRVSGHSEMKVTQ